MNGDTSNSVPNEPAMPKKACMISLMFAVESDEIALAIKHKIDEVLPNIEKKRYTFQITEA